MKKWIALLLTMATLLSMAACVKDQGATGNVPQQTDSNSSSQPSDREMQQISFAGLSMDVDASYGVHERSTGDGIYCGKEMDGYTNIVVEITSFGRDSFGYLMGSSEELAKKAVYDPEHETVGERNGVYYVKRNVDGSGTVDAFYSTDDRYWRVTAYAMGERVGKEWVEPDWEAAIKLATSAKLENAKPNLGVQTVGVDGFTIEVDGGYQIKDNYNTDHTVWCYDGDQKKVRIATELVSNDWEFASTAAALAKKEFPDPLYHTFGTHDEMQYDIYKYADYSCVRCYYLVGDQWWTVTVYGDANQEAWNREIELAASGKVPELGDYDRRNQEQAAAMPQEVTLEYLMSLPANPEVDFVVMDCREYDFSGYVELQGYRGHEPIVVMPETVGGLPVDRINDYRFSNSCFVRGIRLSDTIQIMGTGAFGLNDDLQVIVFGSGMRTIEDGGAFLNCVNLRQVVLNDGLEYIGSNCFSGCDNLKEIEIPSSVTKIHLTAFFSCADDLTIIGEAGSYAEQYAKENNINFRAK